MAKFNLLKSTTVKEFNAAFFDSFGANIRIYQGRSRAEEDATLGECGLTNEGVFECRANLTVGKFNERMNDEFGLNIKVYTCDNWVAVLDGLTLHSAGLVKKQALKSDMEDMIAYQQSEDDNESGIQASKPADSFETNSFVCAQAKVRVYGKAQNRTALGIVHAYMHMYPHATLEDLRKAFPKSLNPDSGEPDNFILVSEIPASREWRNHFDNEDELITTGDGKKVALVMLWTKPSFERIVAQARVYDIVVAKFEAADKGGKKGGFRLEYLNGYIPPKPEKSEPVIIVKEDSTSNRSWLVTLLLCIFLGIFGVHSFYAGKTLNGILQLLTTGGWGIWTFIDFIFIITKQYKDRDGKIIK